MKDIAWIPGAGRTAFVGEPLEAFGVLKAAGVSSLPGLAEARSSGADTLFFAGRGAADLPLLEECLELSTSFIVLGGSWPRKLPASLISLAKQKGLRILGPRSEGSLGPWARIKGCLAGDAALLSEGGETLTHCLYALKRRGVTPSYAVSFGNSDDYTPLEAATSILGHDERVSLFIFILNRLDAGRRFIDFSMEAARKGGRTALLLLDDADTEVREETSILGQYGVAVLKSPGEVVDIASVFSFGKDLDYSNRRVFFRGVRGSELTRLLKREARKAGFSPVSNRHDASFSVSILQASGASASTEMSRRGPRKDGGRLFFTVPDGDPAYEAAALSAGVSFTPGFESLFNSLRLLFDRTGSIRSSALSPFNCPSAVSAENGDAKSLLRAYGIPVAKEVLCVSLPEALSAADTIGYPVVLKVVSPSILRKMEARVVALNIQDEEELRNAYGRTLEKARLARPSAEVSGVLVQEMVQGGTEWRMEFRRSPRFGPLIEVGISGIYGDILPEGVVRAAPLSEDEALLMIRESPGYPLLLEGWRRGVLDEGAFSSAVAALSRLACCEKGVSRLHINPIFVNIRGVLVVDAFIEGSVAKK